MNRISRVLVANRGEIAVRIINACKDLGIESVAAVSEADKESMAARMADRVICIGPPRPADSYLKADTMICAALGTGSDAIHPGYGFLAEQPELAESCKKNNLIFIGPTAENLRQMGNKLVAREIVKGYSISVIPGSEKVRNLEEAYSVIEEIGLPALVKAAAGGGGRGIKILRNPEELSITFETAAAEARVAFGDETLYVERFFPNARHIEVQIVADPLGNVIHVGERDCSLQRRYQKVIEEAPAPSLPDKVREGIRNAGVTIARKMKYESLGTVEFIFDRDSNQFYFLEMNTRIQVEHPVTEMISGMDLVKEQIRIAAHDPLRLSQTDIQFNGHAIECRINAECPEADFQPCPGRITQWNPPTGIGIRVDSHCYPGYFISPYYDSLMGKLITAGKDRAQAIERMQYALAHFIVAGVDTNIPFHQFILNQPDYRQGQIHTRWIENVLSRLSFCTQHNDQKRKEDR
jgi:acetyl-CoA carboxylase biotin carboxylase subunit